MKDYLGSIITPIVQDCVNNAIRTLSQQENGKNGNSEVFLTIKQASDFSHIPVPTLYFYSSKGLVPVIKTGKQLLFRKDLLITWLNEKHKIPIEERIVHGDQFLASRKNKKKVN
jgi:hypothetical protein